MKPTFTALLVLSALMPFGAAVAQAEPADLIPTGGKVITLDPLRTKAEAIAIVDGIIVATGTNAEILESRDADTEVIELGGRTVVPCWRHAGQSVSTQPLMFANIAVLSHDYTGVTGHGVRRLCTASITY